MPYISIEIHVIGLLEGKKKHLLQLNKLLLKRNSNQFHDGRERSWGRDGKKTPRDNKNSNAKDKKHL